MQNIVEKIVNALPYIGKWRKVFLEHSYPGKFDSPIPNWKLHQENNFDYFPDEVNGIDLRSDEQVALCRKLKPYVKLFDEKYLRPLETNGNLFSLHNNNYFKYYDASTLFAYIMHFKPNRIIEIGSGFSSSLMLDTNKHYFNDGIELTFIDPNPERLLNLVGKNNKFSLHKSNVQNINVKIFEELGENDFLFIDSSHIVKANSDLHNLIFDILPILGKNIHIHFHDIFYPFLYKKIHFENKYAWNEAYFLRAFLMYNQTFAMEFMNTYLAEKHKNDFYNVFNINNTIESIEKANEGSIWIKKI